MTTRTVDSVDVDVCSGGCGGVWFDQYEFKKFDEAHEAAGEELLDVKTNPNAKPNLDQRNCPKCRTIVMRRYFTSHLRQIEIDECGKCAGIFLDANELRRIRAEFPTEKERKAAAQKFIDDVFQNKVGDLRSSSHAVSTDNGSSILSRFFRFVLPSNYFSND